MTKKFHFIFINLFLLISNSVLALTPVFINEIHYDNIGDDSGEAIEIFGPAATDIDGWRIVRYNGDDQIVYTTPSAEPPDSDTLSGTIPDMGNGYGVIVVNYKSNGLQNDKNGIALVNKDGTVLQFLSYEGSFTASDGAANGKTSTDIGVAESNTTTQNNHSLQLIGTGTNDEDFTWNTAIANTFGRLNTGQALPSEQGDILINEIVTDPQQDWSTHNFTGKIGTSTISNVDEWVELYIATAGLNLTDWTIELNDGSDVIGDLTNNNYGAFQTSTYISLNGGEFTNTAQGDYLVLGNVDSSGQMSNNITIVLKDPTATVIDQVQIGEGGAPDGSSSNGNATGVTDEAIARLPNATDTSNNVNDFNKIAATIGRANECGSYTAKIHTIQGNGTTSTEIGNTHTIEGVVVGDFQADNQLEGFFVQEEDTEVDGDSLTSEGIFVYNPNGTDVSIGDLVIVTGEVDEFNDLTELKNISNVTICSHGATVIPATINLPLADDAFLERYEGMSVNLPQTLTVSDNDELSIFGQLTLSKGRLFNPTNVTEPGAAANAFQSQNDLNRIIIDDGNTTPNPEPIIYPSPQLSATHTLRSGNTVTGITGVLTYSFDKYRVHPTSTPTFIDTNPRVPASVSGRLKVASFNVLNYFNGDGGFPTSHGADTASEFTRQRDKIISAIVAMGADIVGLMEMENDGYGTNSAIQDLVNGLNAVAPNGTTYSFIKPDFELGSDEIKVAIIYCVETVIPVDMPATTTNPPFDLRRPPLAQTFMEKASAEQMTVVVNHFKAKGSCPTDGSLNEDQDDGQGCWNAERIQAANTLNNWLATDPTSGGDNILIIGDLNAYAKEEPITAIKNAGYTDLVETFIGANAYSYVYNGQAGYLDHALASASLTSKITSVTEWHINADEPQVIDYNEESKSSEQLTNLYNVDPYRASDHDPLIIGIEYAINDSAVPTPAPSPPLPSTMTVTVKYGGNGFGKVTSQPSGINCQNDNAPCEQTFDIDTNVTLIPVANVGSEFLNFTGDNDCQKDKILLTSDVTCTVNFELEPRTLSISGVEHGTVSSSPGGIVCGSGGNQCSDSFEDGEMITLSITLDNGWLFSGWEGDCDNGSIELLSNMNCQPKLVQASTIICIEGVNCPEATLVYVNPKQYEAQFDLTPEPESEPESETTTPTVPTSPKPESETTTPTVPTFSGGSGGVPACSTSGIVNSSCNAGGQTVTDLKEIKEGRQISNAIIETKVTNNGWLSNVTIGAEGIIFGGIATGYIKVEGAFENFEFRGASISGINEAGEVQGVLGGKVVLASKVDGVVENVRLAPDTQIVGNGKPLVGSQKNIDRIGGSIIGDSQKLAILEKVHIKAKSRVSNVIVQEDVTYGEDVTFTNVEFRTKVVRKAILKGRINGTPFKETYTKIESVTVRANSHLSNLIIGDNVRFEEDVTLDESVTFSVHQKYMETHSRTLVALPKLNGISAIDNQGNSVSTWAILQGGARLVGSDSNPVEDYQKRYTFKRSQQKNVEVHGNVLTDVRHLWQKADILVVFAYTPPGASLPSFYMLDNQGTPLPWDGAMSSLVSFQDRITLVPVIPLPIWNNPLDILGDVRVYFGYRLIESGTLVYSTLDVIGMTLTE